MLIEIKNRWTAAVIFSGEFDSLKFAVESAVKINTDLRGANLIGADLRAIRDDIFAVISAVPSEVQFLIDSMNAGKIDGSQYRGDCCCLVGTLEKNCGKNLEHNSRRISESWFTQFKSGMTPENNPNMKITRDWIQSWLDSMIAAFSTAAK